MDRKGWNAEKEEGENTTERELSALHLALTINVTHLCYIHFGFRFCQVFGEISLFFFFVKIR
jgi:hypothetical protein